MQTINSPSKNKKKIQNSFCQFSGCPCSVTHLLCSTTSTHIFMHIETHKLVNNYNILLNSSCISKLGCHGSSSGRDTQREIKLKWEKEDIKPLFSSVCLSCLLLWFFSSLFLNSLALDDVHITSTSINFTQLFPASIFLHDIKFCLPLDFENLLHSGILPPLNIQIYMHLLWPPAPYKIHIFLCSVASPACMLACPLASFAARPLDVLSEHRHFLLPKLFAPASHWEFF